ncbi:MAG: metallophosphoesterase, partial [Pseudomonadota bacterium]
TRRVYHELATSLRISIGAHRRQPRMPMCMKVPENAMNSNASIKRLFRARAVLFVAALGAGANVLADDWTFDGVDRVVAISDVHGDYEAMLATLTRADVVDGSTSWIAGNDHLVIVGDLLDRGPDSRAAMDLVIRLEEEAAEAGGRVHLLLGNHEVMNLVGDLRYVAAEEFSAFADDEDPEEREAWFQWYLDQQTLVVDEATERAEFDERYPTGFFGHRRAFRGDGYYGKWLLDQPLMVVVNGTAFIHGGLSAETAARGLDGTNVGLMRELGDYVLALDSLVDARLIDPAENFYRHADALESVAPADASLKEAISTAVRLSESDIHASASPVWYRGNIGCGPLIEDDSLDASLASVGARRVVVGHTPTLTRQVLSRLDGKVVEIDTGMLTAYYRGSGNALVIEDDTLAVVSEAGGVASVPTPHPRRVGFRSNGISATALAEALEQGAIISSESLRKGQRAMTVEHDGQKIAALFIRNPRGKGFVPELAAYQLDQHLGLDMVPVTVQRTIDGDAGVLQFVPERSIDEAARREAGRGTSAWCPLPKQWDAMYVFDALVFNPGRPTQYMTYSPDNWQLILTGNGEAFTTSRGRPGYLKSYDLLIGNAWVAQLEALDETTIETLFADSLDKKRRRALLARRDALLKDAAASRETD